MNASPTLELQMKRSWISAAFAALAIAAPALIGGCAHGANNATPETARPGALALPADSATVALWHMDETAGTLVADVGPFRLDGTAGIEARTSFGRFGRARSFTHSIDSFVFVPYQPSMEPHSALTVEAWVWVSSYGLYEDTPIVGRWTQEGNRHSWLFSIVGFGQFPPAVPTASPGDHSDLIVPGTAGHLMFAFQPEEAGAARSYFTTQAVPLNRWTHVAATYDGAVVRLWIDGVLDAQYASLGRIRSTGAALEIANAIDPRWLSTFGGDLRADRAPDPTAYYAFEGLIDEVRISAVARSGFEYARGR
jgi:Concanavalin A-like lectin/glucanases superfamily